MQGRTVCFTYRFGFQAAPSCPGVNLPECSAPFSFLLCTIFLSESARTLTSGCGWLCFQFFSWQAQFASQHPPYDGPFRVLEMCSKSFVLLWGGGRREYITLDRLTQPHLVDDQSSGEGLTFLPSYVVSTQVPLTKKGYGLGTVSLCF